MTSTNFYIDLPNEGNTPSANSGCTQHPDTLQQSSDTRERLKALIAQLKASGADITSGYNDCLKVAFALAAEFGESGSEYFHKISALYSGYERQECDKKYDQCLKSDTGKTNIGTIFYLAEQQGIKPPHQERNNRSEAHKTQSEIE